MRFKISSITDSAALPVVCADLHGETVCEYRNSHGLEVLRHNVVSSLHQRVALYGT